MSSTYAWTCDFYIEGGTYDTVNEALRDALTHQKGPDFEDFDLHATPYTKDGYDLVSLAALFNGGGPRVEAAEKWIIEQVTWHAKKPACITWTDGGGDRADVWAWNGSREELIRAVGIRIAHDVSEAINCFINDQLLAGVTVNEAVDIVEALYTQIGTELLATHAVQTDKDKMFNMSEGDE